MEQNAWSLVAEPPVSNPFVWIHAAETRIFAYTSVEINQRVGAYLKERCGKRVDLSNAELTCSIEIVDNAAYIYVDRIPRPRGACRPQRAARSSCLLSGGIDSPVAAWKMIKRGCTAIFVHFHSFPYTNKESQEKAKQLALLLSEYQLRARLYLVPFAEVQRHIMVETPAETRVILYRRYMMRLAEKIAWREKARVLVTGDSVGQVASQTIENIDVISRAVTMPILRPLVGDDKNEIVDIARRIGTYRNFDPARSGLLFPVRSQASGNSRAPRSGRGSRRAVCRWRTLMKQALKSAEVLLQYPAWHANEARTVC